MHRWLLLLLLLGVAACRGSGATPPSATTTLLPDTTVVQVTTTTTPGFEVPTVIDLPYVQRVLEAIYHLEGEAFRYAYAKKVPDAQLNARLEALFGGQALVAAKQVVGENAAEGFALFANPPGDPVVHAVEVVQATSDCLVVRAKLDFGPIFKDPRPPQPQAIIQLSPADVLPENPTGWGVLGSGTPAPGQDVKC